MRCKAIQYSDQMCCSICKLQWDVNDPDPPKCRRVGQMSEKATRALKRIRKQLLQQKEK